MDSDYSEDAYSASSDGEQMDESASMRSSDDDYAFDNAAAQFAGRSKVRGAFATSTLGLLR